jgi:hypothetical protein
MMVKSDSYQLQGQIATTDFCKSLLFKHLIYYRRVNLERGELGTDSLNKLATESFFCRKLLTIFAQLIMIIINTKSFGFVSFITVAHAARIELKELSDPCAGRR